MAHSLTPDSAALSPGKTVIVRDEEWLITSTEPAVDGVLVNVRGQSELVRDVTASFYTSLDDVQLLDPTQASVIGDGSSHYRLSKLWLESLIRKTPIPYGDTSLSVSSGMLLDSLEYQKSAVRKALDEDRLRPRILIADAVGLGKTLEIGMILSELVRRGRGDRILVVTPRHVLEQMQHEMWCRFGLPLVRLDTEGIQKVRRVLPASRNPFTYYKRCIVSLDTLKQPRYKHSLSRQHWDIVVIDECHNVTNSSTQNNELAELLAPNTEALILASATPHNGRDESFSRLIRLLDPSAVPPSGEVQMEKIQPLVVRRHRNSAEVENEVGDNWAVRAEPEVVVVEPSAAEDAVATELSQVWLHPTGQSPYSGKTDRLFPWTLAKAFLSSPAALAESIDNRLHLLDKALEVASAAGDGPAAEDAAGDAPASAVDTAAIEREIAALQRLADLNAAAMTPTAGKCAALVNQLMQIGVGPKSDTRVVVFAERRATLDWLRRELPQQLGFTATDAHGHSPAVQIMHGQMPDAEQMNIIDSFKLANSPIRVLVTGDVASEGVNLHKQCHHLIHYDIPWSLIRIEQRNGRIDRYGQHTPPVITSLLLHPSDPQFAGDMGVLESLLHKERAAHEALGDVTSIMGKYSAEKEEDTIQRVLAGTLSLDEAVPTVTERLAQGGVAALFDFLSVEPAAESAPPPRLPQLPRLLQLPQLPQLPRMKKAAGPCSTPTWNSSTLRWPLPSIIIPNSALRKAGSAGLCSPRKATPSCNPLQISKNGSRNCRRTTFTMGKFSISSVSLPRRTKAAAS